MSKGTFIRNLGSQKGNYKASEKQDMPLNMSNAKKTFKNDPEMFPESGLQKKPSPCLVE